MAAAPHPANPTPRFNPFVFPPDTTFRFVLLIVSIVGASLFIYNTLHFNLTYQTQLEQMERCRPLGQQIWQSAATLRNIDTQLQQGLATVQESEAANQQFLAAEKA